MSYVSDIREICGDYAIDVKYSDDQQFALFFNSRRNAQTVKRCIEVDDSIPNVATAVDFVEVVRCRDCKYCEILCPVKEIDKEAVVGYKCLLINKYKKPNGFCDYGERREK